MSESGLRRFKDVAEKQLDWQLRHSLVYKHPAYEARRKYKREHREREIGSRK